MGSGLQEVKQFGFYFNDNATTAETGCKQIVALLEAGREEG